jgi:DnaJ-domain-containing protein 1
MNGTSFAGVQAAQPGATAAALPNTAGTDAPYLTQIEQLLGEETEPDAAFFIDSWTVGVAASSESFLRRQEERKKREHEVSAWSTLSSFTPFFVTRAEVATEAAWPLREAQSSMADLHWIGYEEEDGGHATDQAEMGCPLTPDSACRVLGVTVTSTREQIRTAYRKMASRYHPDRLAGAEGREQKLASDRMASINEAYRLLCAGLAGRSSTF